MTDYEILLLLDPELSEEQQGAVVTRTRDVIEKSGGTVDRHDAWGRRKLAYEIDKKGEGHYHLLLFSCAAETLDEVSRVLKIDDTVLRHMATRRVHTGVPEAGPVQPGPIEPSPIQASPIQPGPTESRPAEPVAAAAPTSEDVADDSAPATGRAKPAAEPADEAEAAQPADEAEEEE